MIYKGNIEHEQVIFHVFEEEKDRVVLQRAGEYKSYTAEKNRKQISLTEFSLFVKTFQINMDNLNPIFVTKVKQTNPL